MDKYIESHNLGALILLLMVVFGFAILRALLMIKEVVDYLKG